MSAQSSPSKQTADNQKTAEAKLSFLERAREDLEALRQNHRDRIFFKGTANNIIQALNQAIQNAEEEKHD